MFRIRTTVLLFLFLGLPVSALSQYPFGKNKVVYSNKNWKVLQTENVDIYHYPSERNLIMFIAPEVEKTFVEYSEFFNMKFRGRMPLVLYSSHYEFQQTNIIPSLIGEGTGGFTDLIRGRIAVPFTGSLGDLRHVVRHEMVHAFMLEKLEQVMIAHNRYTYPHPPLWFIEGIAEYVARRHAITETHMYVRDALLNNMLLDLDNIWRIEGTYMMYREGEAVVTYISENFGDQAITQILENWWISDQFSIVLKKTIGLDTWELNHAFMKYIKRRYYPTVLHNSFVPELGLQATEPRTFHSRPVAAGVDGSFLKLYALGAKQGVIDIFEIELDREGDYYKEAKVVSGGRSSRFESLPAFRSKMESRGDTLMFVSKSKERDVIYLWDVVNKRVFDSFSFSTLTVISSPTLSPAGSEIVFSAIDVSGKMDLFLYHIADSRLERLTEDSFTEEDPDYHPTRNIILFSSDRCDAGRNHNTGIYAMDLDTRIITPMTCGDRSDSNPEWSPFGDSFLFTSDINGIYNTYLYRDGTVFQQTNVIGGITSPSFLPDGSGFLASSYHRAEFHIYAFPLRENHIVPAFALTRPDTMILPKEEAPVEEFDYPTKDYTMKLGLDLAGVGIAVDPDYGDVGNGAQLVLTDLLGNHQFFFFIGNTSQGFDDFWKRINAGFTWVNLSRRLNYSLSVFHLTTYWGDFFSYFRSERRYGISGGIRYPFSKFSRVEASLVLKNMEREADFSELGLEGVSSTLASTFFTYVADNTLWTIGGPMVGERYYATVGNTTDLRGRGFDSQSLLIDLRKYLRLTNRIVVAGRFMNRNSWGGDLQLFYLGGPWDLRGYRFREFAGKSVYLFNTELRVPLVDRLSLSLPFGTIEMPMFRGSLFFDVGRVSRFIEETGWIGSFGGGIEMNLGYAPVIRVNFTRTTDFDNISKRTETEFFIGYNY